MQLMYKASRALASLTLLGLAAASLFPLSGCGGLGTDSGSGTTGNGNTGSGTTGSGNTGGTANLTITAPGPVPTNTSPASFSSYTPWAQISGTGIYISYKFANTAEIGGAEDGKKKAVYFIWNGYNKTAVSDIEWDDQNMAKFDGAEHTTAATS